MTAQPLDEIQWKSPEWIQQFGLHTGNVLDYFAESPFYDRTSNNQVLRMQFQFQQIPPNVHPQKYLQDKLTEMVGTEFVIAFVREPEFWVIRKQRRIDLQNTVTQQDYYIIGANVYQSPVIYDILSSRLISSVLSMKKTLNLLSDMSTFSISEGGHSYVNEGADAGSQSSQAKPPTATTATGVNTPATESTPGTASHPTGNDDDGLSSNMSYATSGASGILSSVFDSLLNNVLATTNSGQSIYIDDIPLYGRGSTVEQLGLKLNLNED